MCEVEWRISPVVSSILPVAAGVFIDFKPLPGEQRRHHTAKITDWRCDD